MCKQYNMTLLIPAALCVAVIPCLSECGEIVICGKTYFHAFSRICVSSLPSKNENINLRISIRIRLTLTSVVSEHSGRLTNYYMKDLVLIQKGI